jgi:CRISPR/Cas system CSM-associated protein Csm3 (group 7 of RAMP superfamily)
MFQRRLKMPLQTIDLSGVTIGVSGPMHIGTGFGRGLLNRTVVSGRDGMVYIPGSTIKGKVREACAKLANLNSLGQCPGPHPRRLAEGEHWKRCLICRIFGAPAYPSTLQWHSALLSKDWASALRHNISKESSQVPGQTVTRTQVQISRMRGMAAEARLFKIDAAPFLTGRLYLTPVSFAGDPDVYYELILLLAGLKTIYALGGSRSRGAGHCEIHLPENIQVNGRPISVNLQLDHIEDLALYWEEAEAQHER